MLHVPTEYILESALGLALGLRLGQHALDLIAGDLQQAQAATALRRIPQQKARNS